ncbi:hypothetical protein A2890_01755 [candidate division WWE3 bacterium RIFCSPLOWO2_01_FULL_53_14]|uniref:Aminoglycoside phosphotransferase domain-containing protein n=1 Tax=candidate division WWE3 bacterium RIFCSPLOWO2_01_FULL_53_14 TaxID=1802628 RepID=A0A1F4VSN4_UNCKA|nr:MAG: hypothetical protein A2890_01755 [candidate division WWE3 bacterium RIFCSPLOWO2_01_FULL_53_14]
MSAIPSKVVSAYDLGRVFSTERIPIGFIHQTYKIQAEKGTFILQRMHPILSSEAVAEDFWAVTQFLKKHRFPAPEGVPNKDGKFLTPDGLNVWRMQTFLPGETMETIGSPATAYEAGLIFARFHRTLNKIEHQFRAPVILHNTEECYAAFQQAVKKYSGTDLLKQVAPEVEFVADELPKLFLPHDLPLRVIHGDPKITNILFDEHGKAEAIIDLDNCNRQDILGELGDAFRSWCGKEEEDPKNEFRLDLFQAGWKGYSKGAQGFLIAREKEYLPQALGTITLELASRFLTDYFNDSYFGWDDRRYGSRRAHNLARARGQIALYQDLRKKMGEVREIVKESAFLPGRPL